jgi:hypothetical protein
MNRSPASGERAAIGGFTSQYLVASEMVLQKILAGSFEWVRLVDPDAGRVDDVIIASPNRLDAFQVKWASTKSTYTFGSITKGSDDGPSLWNQLAQGWRSLRTQYPNRSILVHLLSNEIASPNDSKSIGDGTGGFHFQDLWRSVLGISPLPRSVNIAPRYVEAMKILERDSGLHTREFSEFLAHSRLQFDYRDPRDFDADNLHAASRFNQISDLATLLQQRVSESSGAVTITLAELTQQLDWLRNAGSRFNQVFPLDESTYRPIRPTVDQISDAVASNARGYFALLGGPGSGKSTALTHTLRYRHNATFVSYYAFLPDDRSLGRGEASIFWREIYLSLRERGFRVGISFPRSGDEFRHAVSAQLHAASERWQLTGTKLVMLIDGLDHIQREQNPSRSLVTELPLPDQVPDGVLIFLGSQSLNLQGISPAIIAALKAPDRTFQMGRLARSDVDLMIDIVDKERLVGREGRDRIFALGDGHPLATVYLTNRLANIRPEDDVDALLEDAATFDGDIQTTYSTYWHSIESGSTRELLGLLARLRVSFDVRAAVQWVPAVDGRRFTATTNHFFRRQSNGEWTFFHNSFRQFLLPLTATDILDEFDAAVDRQFHERLAELAHSATLGSALSRERIYHLYHAGRSHDVIQVGSQAYFREQFFQLRNFLLIKDDIALVLRAASETQSGLAAARAILIDQEIGSRQGALEQSDFFNSLDAFLPIASIPQFVHEGTRLLIDAKDALTMALRLSRAGLQDEARTILDLAEPLDLLSGAEPVKYPKNEQMDLLHSWLMLASLFRSPTDSICAIGNISVEDPLDRGNAAIDELRDELLSSLGVQIRIRKPAAWTKYLAALQNHPRAQKVLEDIDWGVCESGEAPEDRAKTLEQLIAKYRDEDLSASSRIFIANLAARGGYPDDLLNHLLHTVSQPQVVDLSDSAIQGGGSSLSPLFDRIVLNRLLSRLGRATPPTVAIEWPQGDADQLRVRFERCLVQISNIFGSAQRGNISPPRPLIQELRDCLRFFERKPTEGDAYRIWYQYGPRAREYFSYLIRAVTAHGIECVMELSKAFGDIWNNPNTMPWSTYIRRHITIELYKAGVPRDQTAIRLSELVSRQNAGDDVHTAINDIVEEAKAWTLLGESHRAHALVKVAMESTFGITHDKDRQIQTWVDWLKQTADRGAVDVRSETVRFARGLHNIVKNGHGRGATEAAAELLAISAQHDVEGFPELRQFFYRSGIIDFEHAYSGLLLGLLEHPDAPVSRIAAFLIHLGTAIDLPDVPKICKRVVDRSLILKGEEWTARTISALSDSVQVNEFSKSRNEWFDALGECIRIHGGTALSSIVLPARAPERERRDTDTEITLADGSKISRHALEATIQDIPSLVLALRRATGDTYVSWDRCAKQHIAGASASELRSLLDVLPLDDSAKVVLASRMAARFRILGDSAAAAALAEQALSASKPIGWISWYDGGTRLYAARELALCCDASRRQKLFRLLVDDYLTEVRNPSDFVQLLDDILPILFDAVPWADLWREVSAHVFQLEDFKSSAPLEVIHGQDVSSTSALTRTLTDDFALPIPELEFRFAKLFAAWMDDDAMTREEIHALGSGTYRDVKSWKQCLALFLSRRTLDERSADERQIIDTLRVDKSVAVRALSSLIGKPWGAAPTVAQDPRFNEMPLALRLELEDVDVSAHNIIGKLRPSDPVPTPSSPADLFNLWRGQLEYISDVTHVPLGNLLLRGQQIADVIAATGGIQSELAYRESSERIGLKMTYRRPWADIGQLAFFQLISELIDCEALDPRRIIAAGLHEFVDATVALLTPKPRPRNWVSDAQMPSTSESVETWIKRCDAKQHRFALDSAASDGFVVLFEYTHYEGHSWNEENETRICVLEVDNPRRRFTLEQNEDRTIRLVPRSSWGYPGKVPKSAYIGNTVVGGYDFAMRSGPKRWFALAPEFANALSLSPVKDYPFAWVDKRGEIAAYSTVWRDGPGPRRPPRRDDVFGKGWLVLLRRSSLAGDARFLMHKYIRREHSDRHREDKENKCIHVSTHDDFATVAP